jgi:hypothetical protein
MTKLTSEAQNKLASYTWKLQEILRVTDWNVVVAPEVVNDTAARISKHTDYKKATLYLGEEFFIEGYSSPFWHTTHLIHEILHLVVHNLACHSDSTLVAAYIPIGLKEIIDYRSEQEEERLVDHLSFILYPLIEKELGTIYFDPKDSFEKIEDKKEATEELAEKNDNTEHEQPVRGDSGTEGPSTRFTRDKGKHREGLQSRIRRNGYVIAGRWNRSGN